METAEKDKKNLLWTVLSYIIITIVILFAIAAILSKLSIGGIQLLTVRSGSMEPTIKTGSLILIKSANNYAIGDIVTYKSSTDPNEKITHRIVDMSTDKGITQYRTEGDANDVADSISVRQDQIVGKELFTVPYIGYPIGYARTVPGLIIIVIVPATIIIYDEALKIRKEAAEIKKRRRNRPSKDIEKIIKELEAKD